MATDDAKSPQNENAAEIRLCCIGLGHFGKLAAKAALKKNVNIVAAFTRKSDIGKDLGDVLELGQKLNTVISPITDLDKILKQTKPNICFDATATTLSAVCDNYTILLNNKVNIISLAEQHVYPFDMKEYKTIKQLAIDNGVTVFGAGLQDLFFQQYSLAASSAILSITGIDAGWYGDFNKGVLVYASYAGTGLTEKEFYEKKINDPKENVFSHLMSEWSIAMGKWYAKQFGLKEKQHKLTIGPILNTNDDVMGISINRQIKKGQNLGINITLKMETEEKVDIYFRNEIRCYNEGTKKKNDIEIVFHGEPVDTKVVVPNVDVENGTIVTAVNRIPQVINAKPGYYNVDELGLATYWKGV